MDCALRWVVYREYRDSGIKNRKTAVTGNKMRMGNLSLIDCFTRVAEETAAVFRMSRDFVAINHAKALLTQHWDNLIKTAPEGKGQPVLVIPGFGANDSMTEPLRAFLDHKGFHAYGWDCGTNFGPKETILRGLKDRLDEIYEKHGMKVHCVGHSLGGYMAREMSREFPAQTGLTVTLGTPFAAAGSKESTSATLRAAFEMLNGGGPQTRKENALLLRAATLPPAPTTSIYTRKDGFVDPVACFNPKSAKGENIEIDASHCGLVAHPLSALIVADRLSQGSAWKKFNPKRYEGFALQVREDQLHLGYKLPRNVKADDDRGLRLFPA